MTARTARTTAGGLLLGTVPILAGLLLLGSSVACGRTPSRPDVLLVSIDTLRPDHLGCYGYIRPTSPTIDALAETGTRFTQAVSSTSWTLPAHAAMFTGLYDGAHGALDNDRRLGDANITLAERLRDHGYRTAGFFGGPFLHPVFGLDQGFDHYQSCMTELPDDAPDATVRRESRAPRGAAHADITGPRTVEEFERWLATVDDRPFFAFVHLWDVHYDYLAPKRYVDMFDPGYEGPITGVDFMHDPSIRPGMPPRDLRHLLALYDAEIRFTDDILAQIIASLTRAGRRDDLLVIVTADHGEEFFEHGGKGHSRTLFDEVIRVPLIMNHPSIVPAGMVVDEQVRLIDLMPTILSLTGAPAPQPVQGRDLTPFFTGEGPPPAWALSELYVDGLTLRSLRSPEFKLLDPGRGMAAWGFDLVEDPREQRPIPSHERSLVAGRELTKEIGRSLRIEEMLGASEPPIQLDEEMRERLRSLGYIGDEP